MNKKGGAGILFIFLLCLVVGYIDWDKRKCVEYGTVEEIIGFDSGIGIWSADKYVYKINGVNILSTEGVHVGDTICIKTKGDLN